VCVCCVCDLFLLLHRYHYDFTPIADVASKPEHATVDILGVVTSVGQLTEVRTSL